MKLREGVSSLTFSGALRVGPPPAGGAKLFFAFIKGLRKGHARLLACGDSSM